VPVFIGAQTELVEDVERAVAETFRLPVERHPPGFDPELAFDAPRGQYNSRMLLAQLVRDLRPHAARVLGITSVDLFIPVLTFVFGEAQLDGAAAIVSTHRLAPEQYGLPPSPQLLRQRLVKEAVHELGHTYGLVHCHEARCVMASSTYVEEIDLKGARLCARCAARVRARRNGAGEQAPERSALSAHS
jgi:archaemetzincin